VSHLKFRSILFSKYMGQQLNKKIKQARRKAYLKRKNKIAKQPGKVAAKA